MAHHVFRLLALMSSGVGLAIYSFYRQLPAHAPAAWHEQTYSGPLGALRSAFMTSIQGVSEDSIGLVAGLAIGDTSRISSDVSDQLKVVSLTHLTAVSGANCAIVTGLIFMLLSRLALKRWLRICLALLALAFYVLLVGPQPSVLRAAAMAFIVLLAKGLGRSSAPNQALALCIVVLLVANPWLAIDYGFQLSALATLGIIELAPKLADRLRLRIPNLLALALAVSIAAQMICLPVLLQLQPGLSTYSVPANLLAEPLVAPITVLGMLACLVSPALPGVAGFLSWMASLGAELIVTIATWLASAPSATLSWPAGPMGSILALALISAFTMWLKSRNTRLRFIAGFSVAVFTAVTMGGCASQNVRQANWPPADWVVVSCDVGQGDAIVVRSEGRVALIDVGRKPNSINRCLDRLGVKSIDLLVLTHFDLDHVGGLSGAIRGRAIDQALITGYEDVRPAAALTYSKLRASARAVTKAETGMSGWLGSFAWKVLSPHHGALEAQNSNDGSVTMLFSSPELILLTLADLGERGQRRLMDESAQWFGSGFSDLPLVVKVSHHGSSDQYPELYRRIEPKIALVSVGLGNDYGHPTDRTLNLLRLVGAEIHRTDSEGSLAVRVTREGLRLASSGQG
jgi:competence protein ComEC